MLVAIETKPIQDVSCRQSNPASASLALLCGRYYDPATLVSDCICFPNDIYEHIISSFPCTTHL
jgi:hypothetical protein